jgi:pyruvate dehydrogenase E1 component
MSEKLLVPDIGEFEKVEVIELLVKVGDKIKCCTINEQKIK